MTIDHVTLFAVLVQLAAVAYWGGGLKQRVEDLGKRLELVEKELATFRRWRA